VLPTVSINLCCYNSETLLEETLQSIFAQTYKDWELVIINDGSTDSTESIIRKYINQGYPIVYYWQENHGLGYSRNEALKRSRGEYIAFIDHDDIWMPKKLEKQVAILERNLDADFLFSNYYVLKGSRKILASRKRQPQGNVFECFLHHHPVAILTTIIRNKALKRLDSLFDTNLRLAEDFDLFLRLLYRSKAVYQDEPVAIYRVHSRMCSIQSLEKWPDELEYVFKKFGRLHQDFENVYSDALSKSRLDLEYLRAKICMMQGDCRSARRKINPYKFFCVRNFFLYFFSYMPVCFRNYMSLHFSKSPF
jgi:glycosyltransferase involved in cell wall biosynthesis